MLKKKLFLLAIAVLMGFSTLAWAVSPQALSLTVVSKNPDGKVFRITKSYLLDGDKYRVDYLSPEGAVNSIGIYRKDKGLIWGIEPDTKTYTEKALTPMYWDSHLWAIFPDPAMRLKKTGETKYLNFTCDISVFEDDGYSNIFTVARDTNIILKFQLKQKDKLVQTNETTELKLEKPAASLFEIPAGYKKRQIIQ